MVIAENLDSISCNVLTNYSDTKIGKNTYLLLTFLVNCLISDDQYVIPSIKFIENHLKSLISTRTIKRMVKTFVELEILQKYPRSTTQTLAVNLNNNLLRFILIINQPDLDLSKHIQSKLSEELKDSFLQQLIACKRNLEDLIDSLTNTQKTVQELCEHFLYKFPPSIVNECLSDELEVQMRETFDWFVGEELLTLPKQLEVLLTTKEEFENDSNF